VLDWPDRKMACDIFPRSAADHVKSTRRLVEIATGDAAFDEKFVVRGAPGSEVREHLSDGVRWQLNRILCLEQPPQLYVLLWRGQLLIQQRSLYRRLEDLEPFVEIALDLYDQLLLTRAEGIEFMDSGTASTLHEVICKICGESIRADLVYCRRCKTPHHGDCWQYTGGCSVFGCRETRFLRPQSGSPSGDTPPVQT
jgi:hypothetical protein